MSLEKILSDLFVDGKLDLTSVPNEDGLILTLSTTNNRTLSYATNIQVKNRLELNNVDNTRDINKIVLSASKLTTARTINGVSFDGTSNIILPLDGGNVDSVFGREGDVIAENGDYSTDLITESTDKLFQTANQRLFNDATSSIQTQLNNKQNILVSGTNIKTINGIPILGAGNLVVGGAVDSVFGRIGIIQAVAGDYSTSLITESTDKLFQTANQRLFNDATSSIQTQLNARQLTLISGTNIKTINGTSILGSGNITIDILVTSVFGRMGAVTAQSGDYSTSLITESTDKLFQTANQRLFNDATSSIQTQLNSKQVNLISGSNIKTINGVTILGAGNIAIPVIAGGTANYVTKFNPAGNNIVISQIVDTGSYAGIGIPSPTAKWEINSSTLNKTGLRFTQLIKASNVPTLFATTTATGRSRMRIDNNNYIYIADTYNDRILKVDPTGSFTVLASSIGGISDLCLASDGFIYTCGNFVYKIDPNTGDKTTLSTTSLGGYGITQGFDKNFYIANGVASRIMKVDYQTGIVSIFATLPACNSICQLSDGYFYVAGNSNFIYKVDSTTGTYTSLTVVTGASTHENITAGRDGYLYISSASTQSLYKVDVKQLTSSFVMGLGGGGNGDLDVNFVVYGINGNGQIYKLIPNKQNLLAVDINGDAIPTNYLEDILYLKASEGVRATDSTYVGTTRIPFNRSPSSQMLTGVSIDGNSGSTKKLLPVGDYEFKISDSPSTWHRSLKLGFVNDVDGYPSYGSVLRGSAFNDDGSAFEFYFPYSDTYGGDSIRYRLGSYPNAGMSGFRILLDNNNFSRYALPVAGKAVDSGKWNGQLYTPEEQADELTYLLSYNTNDRTWKPSSAGLIKSFLGISGFTPSDYLKITGGSMLGQIKFESNDRSNSITGTYDATKIQAIWSMDQIFRSSVDGRDFSGLYGAAYYHPNNGNYGQLASDHQFVWVANGSPQASLGTNIWSRGSLIAQAGSAYQGILGSRPYWGGTEYPSIYGTATDQFFMLTNPHIPYLQSGWNGFTGSMSGARIRFASNPSATSRWDLGIGTNGYGEDIFSIGRDDVPFLAIDGQSTYALKGLSIGASGRNGLLSETSHAIAIGDSDTGFRQVGDGVLQMVANNVALYTATSGGITLHTPIFGQITNSTEAIYLRGEYISGGQEKPNNSIFGPAKLKLQMLSSANLGGGNGWNDVLWMSSYSGGDVKQSNALIFGKDDGSREYIAIAKQNYDSGTWGIPRELLHTNNYSDFAVTAHGNFTRNGTLSLYSDDGSGTYNTRGLELREAGLVGSTQSADVYAPSIGFHWGGLAQKQIAMRYDGGLVIRDNPGSGNLILHASNIGAYALPRAAQSNWNDYGVQNNVIGMLSWNKHKNGHVIFDASEGISPSGGTVSESNSQIPWTASYPTLMGWNGTNTYGVRVDMSRYSDSAGYANSAGSAPNGLHVNQYYNVQDGDGNGLRFWGGADQYKISMGTGGLYNFGPVYDYSIKMQMDGTAGRGFTWGVAGSVPIAGLSISGDMQIAGVMTASYFRSINNIYLDQQYGSSIIGMYSATKYQGIFSMGASWVLPLDGSSLGNHYGLAWTHSNVGGQSKPGLEHQLLTTISGVTQSAIGAGIWTIGNITSQGTGYFTGDVQAYYSDERLKTKTRLVKNAIDKVKSLNAFYYKNNRIANENGYKNNEEQFGLSAQEVQRVLPEIVTLAPFDMVMDDNGNKSSKSGEHYLTVNYGKLVPLLVEAIKDQQKIIEEQKEQIKLILEHLKINS